MKICLDLQVCQSREFRGIGRYSLDFAKAIVDEAHARGDEINVLLSGNFRDRIGLIQQELDLGQESYRFVQTAQFPANDGLKERLDTLFLNRISDVGNYDVVHDAHAFAYPEHFPLNDCPDQAAAFHSATFYDLIPMKMPERYLTDDRIAGQYGRQVASLKRRDLLFAISDATRRDGIEMLGLPSDRIVTVSTGVDDRVFHPKDIPDERRMQLFARYGIRKPFLLYTTGFDPRKNLSHLVQAFAELPPRIRRSYQLVVVCPRNAWSEELISAICCTAGVCDGREVVFTGFVSDEDLVDLYRTATLFVFPSLYEGFGLPIVEAIRCGTPAIGSDCSSIVELLPLADTRFDPNRTRSIAQCIARVLGDERTLKNIHEVEFRHVAKYTWPHVAQIALDAWHERLDRGKRRKGCFCNPRKFYEKIALEIGESRVHDVNRIVHLCLVNDKCHVRRPRILYDISWWINANVTTGIQRVVSKVSAAFRARHDGFDYQAVALKDNHLLNCRYDKECGRYVYDTPWMCRERDILIMLDSSWECRAAFIPFFEEIHAFGGSVYSVVYDILPVLQPELFDMGIRTIFPLWLRHALRYTDGLVCISKSVGQECHEYATTHRGTLPIGKQMPIGHFYLGADFATNRKNSYVDVEFPFAADARVVISVGTVEPRKNHAYMLDVMERVLRHEPSVCWVIVGQKGWLMDDWTERLLVHPLFGSQIFYYPKADDSLLSALYDRSEFLLNLSKGEGYGLPLIEAGEKGKCVICSDIPVFHEIDRFGFVYCPLKDAEQAAANVADALNTIRQNDGDRSSGVSKFGWADAAQMLVDCVVDNKWDLVVSLDKPVPREKEIRISGEGLEEKEYLFSDFCDSAYVLVEGFAPRESWGVWCIGKKSEMTIKLPETNGDLLLVIKAQCFGDKCMKVRVLMGDGELAVWNVANSAPSDYVLDCRTLPRGKEVDLVFVPSATCRPCDVIEGNADARELSMGLISMKLNQRVTRDA